MELMILSVFANIHSKNMTVLLESAKETTVNSVMDSEVHGLALVE